MIIGKSLTALGGGGLKPEIRVTAKAGALLNLHYKDSTIILQSYQLGAEETQHTFVVDVSETAYVVEDVTNSASVEVLVDSVAVFDVEIEYALWLYKDGDERDDVTGGWTVTGSLDGNTPTLTRNADNLYFYHGAGVRWHGKLLTSNNVDANGMTKVYVDTEYSAGYPANGDLIVNYGSKTLLTYYSYSANVNYPQNKRQVLSATISGTENAKLSFNMTSYQRSSNAGSLTVYRVWFE